jgi:hypothetical protein
MHRAMGAAFVSAAVALSVAGCSKKPAQEPFACERIQARAESCEANTLALIKKGIQEREEADAGALQYKMVEVRLRKRLAEKQTLKQCEQAQREPSAGHTQQLEIMRECHRAADCDAFAKCMLQM